MSMVSVLRACFLLHTAGTVSRQAVLLSRRIGEISQRALRVKIQPSQAKRPGISYNEYAGRVKWLFGAGTGALGGIFLGMFVQESRKASSVRATSSPQETRRARPTEETNAG